MFTFALLILLFLNFIYKTKKIEINKITQNNIITIE